MLKVRSAPGRRPFFHPSRFYLDDSDFPYQRPGSTEEVPFADHLSVVRLLGGIGSKANPSRHLDLATRNAGGRATGKFDKRSDFFSASRYLRFGTNVHAGVRLFVEGCDGATPSLRRYRVRSTSGDEQRRGAAVTVPRMSLALGEQRSCCIN